MKPMVTGYVRRIAVVLGIVVVVVGGWTAFRLWRAWNDVDRIAFDPESARAALEATGAGLEYQPVPDEPLDDQSGPIVEGGEVSREADTHSRANASGSSDASDVYLIIGSDQRSTLDESRRADVILLFIDPVEEGVNPILVSIPRDLYLHNPCTDEMTRVNANLNGCGGFANGPEQLTVAIEDFTGIEIDHFVVFDFDGFRAVIDRVGGVEVCVETAVWDPNTSPTPLSLPAGCSTIDGDMALSWVRSRKTLQRVGGEWHAMPNVSDLTRNQRQQDLIIQALSRVKKFTDISELTALVEELSETFTVDEDLTLRHAISIAWSLRSLDLTTIVRPVLEVANFIAPDGAYVLVPTTSFEEAIVAADPTAAVLFDSPGT